MNKKSILVAVSSFLLTSIVIIVTIVMVRANSNQPVAPVAPATSEAAAEASASAATTPATTSAPTAPAQSNPNHEIKIVKASYDYSLGNQAGNSYRASNLIDKNPATAWAVTLSDNIVDYEDIIGPVLKLSSPSRISEVEITNGYCKNSSSFSNNTRAAWIEVARWHPDLDGEYAEGQSEGSEKRDIIYAGPLSDTMKPQRLKVSPSFDNSKPTTHIVLRFKKPGQSSGYYRGAKWNDLCISEFRVFGR